MPARRKTVHTKLQETRSTRAPDLPKALGLTVPPSVLDLADEVIE